VRGWILDVHQDGPGLVAMWFKSETGSTIKLLFEYEPYFLLLAPSWKLEEIHERVSGMGATSSEFVQKSLPSGKFKRMLMVRAKDGPSKKHLLKKLLRDQDVIAFDADIEVERQFLMERGLFPLARVDARRASGGFELQLRDDLESLEYDMPEFKRALLSAKTSRPFKTGDLEELNLSFEGAETISYDPKKGEEFVSLSDEVLRRGVDILFTKGGDGFLLQSMEKSADQLGVSENFSLNRDMSKMGFGGGGFSFTSYGVVRWKYRPALLRGRYHIDLDNFMGLPEGGLEGVFDLSRSCCVSVQKTARTSIGGIMSSLEDLVAFKRNIAIPMEGDQPEYFKSVLSLIRSDRGGFVMNPIPGVHEDVVEIDFMSLYPSLIAMRNISSETMRPMAVEGDITVPELDLGIASNRFGIVSDAVAFLLRRRIACSHMSSKEDDVYDRRQKAIKLILCSAFGYLGFRKAKFGRVEAHMATTAFAREALLKVIGLAESMGFKVVHAIVDAIWVREGETDHESLVRRMSETVGVPAKLKVDYKWVAFLNSKINPNVPVPTRYFGVTKEGGIKVRGIEARRNDTPPFVSISQLSMLESMAKVGLDEAPVVAVDGLRSSLRTLREGSVQPELLVIRKKLSRSPSEYRHRVAQALASQFIEREGGTVMPGMEISFIMTEDGPQPSDLVSSAPDLGFYETALIRAGHSILEPFGFTEEEVESKAHGQSGLSSFLMPRRSQC